MNTRDGKREVFRGDIYYIAKSKAVGSEQHGGRPAVVVSNDKNNKFSTVVEVVFLTTAKKTNLPTHVAVQSCVKPSIALCEQVHSVAISRLESFFGKCSEEELSNINKALLISLGLSLSDSNKQETSRQRAGCCSVPIREQVAMS